MMLTVATTAPQYLPTNTDFWGSPWVIGGIIVAVCILIASIAFTVIKREEPYAIFGGLLVSLAIVILSVSFQADSVSHHNLDNLVANVKTAYNIDSMKVEEESPLTKLSNNEPISVIVTGDGKAYKVLLSQNNDTFEPSLSSYENDSVDINRLKKEQ